ncbi:MAG TPA: hypothetical protein VKB58_00375 [Terriglobales bacterium]|jgi:hypothetical protein|nr:hypothetical protein [Terriglobales bacterium]
MKRRLQAEFAAAVLALGCNLVLTAQNPSGSWKEYTYPDDSFAITLPADPDIHKDLTKPTTIYSLHATSDIIVKVSVASGVEECPTTLASLKAQSLKLMGQSAVKDFSATGYPGFEYESNGNQGDRIYGRLVCAGARLYSVESSWPVDDPKPAVVSRIVDSFRILSPAAHNN